MCFDIFHPVVQRLVVAADDGGVLHEHVAVCIERERRLVRIAVPASRRPALGGEEDVVRAVEPGAHEYVPAAPIAETPAVSAPVRSGQRSTRRVLRVLHRQVRVIPCGRKDRLSNPRAGARVYGHEHALCESIASQARNGPKHVRKVNVFQKRIVKANPCVFPGHEHVGCELRKLGDHIIVAVEVVDPGAPLAVQKCQRRGHSHREVAGERFVVGSVQIERIVQVHQVRFAPLVDPVVRIDAFFLEGIAGRGQRSPYVRLPVPTAISTSQRIVVNIWARYSSRARTVARWDASM